MRKLKMAAAAFAAAALVTGIAGTGMYHHASPVHAVAGPDMYHHA
jgi:hypothetical protein